MDLSGKHKSADFVSPIYGLMGNYTLSAAACVPYVTACLPLERVVTELKTYDLTSPSIDLPWSLDDLFQRNIDPKRVEMEIIDGYLKNQDKLKFFNALTFIMLPKKIDGNPAEVFLPYEGSNPPIRSDENSLEKSFVRRDDNPVEDLSFGGVQCHRVSDFVRLRWDQSRVDVVAVDGQHRLFALRKWYEDRDRVLSTSENKTSVPVLFLLLHQNAGFKSSANKGLRYLARDIFTDLNKHAKSVDDARVMILDDRSLAARCVRALVTASASEDSLNSIPLSMVRWQDPNQRFDQSYHLNSLMNLHEIVEEVLELDYPSRPLDQKRVENFIKSLNKNLRSDDNQELTAGGISLQKFYEDEYFPAETDETVDRKPNKPFTHLPAEFLGAAIARFESLHKPYILAATMGLKPYRDLLTFARSRDMVAGKFAKFNSQPPRHRQRLTEDETMRQWCRTHVDTPREELEQAKQADGIGTWVYKSVFQKAVVRVFKRICYVHRPMESRLGTSKDLVEYLDNLYERGKLSLKAAFHDPHQKNSFLWCFLGLDTNGKVRANEKSVQQLERVLVLSYYAHRRRFLTPDARSVSSPEEILKYFKSKSKRDDEEKPPIDLWPSSTKFADDLIAEFAERISANQWISESDDEALNWAQERLVEVLRALLGFSNDEHVGRGKAT